MNLNELPDMSDALKKVQQFDEKKKEKELDPVGQEDDDVDNDGDSDSSDEYLKKRRKAIAKAMEKEEVENVEEGKFSGSKSHIQRDGTAPAPERTAAERKKDRRCLLYTSPSPRDRQKSRMPSSA